MFGYVPQPVVTRAREVIILIGSHYWSIWSSCASRLWSGSKCSGDTVPVGPIQQLILTKGLSSDPEMSLPSSAVRDLSVLRQQN